jgi:histidyl-tRNA synthetase
MARPTPVSGFPEWLPAGRLVEQAIIDRLRGTFELWGYSGLETRAVEPLEQLLSKGEIDKEVYVLRRLQADADDPLDASGLALHYDLTVPFARYVVENSGRLHFPLKRYQIQKCWRGERPQEGRYREFLQADIDVVGLGDLPFHYETELPVVLAEALSGLPLPPVRMQVNNRKVSQGFFRGLGLEDLGGVLRTVDKIDKIGPVEVARLLQADLGATAGQAEAVLAFASIQAADGSVADRVAALGVADPLLDEGMGELVGVVEAARAAVPGFLVADLKIARGLDYYTGTVYETQLVGHEALGSICSGGRYDTLASDGDVRYPGVGVSVGVTRLVSRLLGQELVTSSRGVPTCVLVAVVAEDQRAASDRTAAALRRRGIAAEVAPRADKFGKQIRYADRRGIPFVWFPSTEEPTAGEVKDIRSGEQVPAVSDEWQPPAADLQPHLVAPDTTGD